MKPELEFDDFLAIENQLEIKIGYIVKAEPIPKSYGLALTVDFGNDDVRSVFTNLGKTHSPEALKDLVAPFITNLKPSIIKGVKSEAMIMVGKSLEGEDQVGLNYLRIGTKLF